MFRMARAQKSILAVAVVLLLLPSLAECSTVHALAIGGQLPQPQGFVSDFADKLSSDSKRKIESLLRKFADQNGIDVAVVTIPFEYMHGQAIENYSLALGRRWGIGRGQKKLGLLLLIAIKPADVQGRYSGATRLEVSRNLERDIPNDLAQQIIRTMRGDFQGGRFDQAINAGVELLLTTLSDKRGIAK